jgi:hypothetical protein
MNGEKNINETAKDKKARDNAQLGRVGSVKSQRDAGREPLHEVIGLRFGPRRHGHLVASLQCQEEVAARKEGTADKIRGQNI